MLGRIVNHLRENGISFRLSSQPSPEPLPEVAHPVPPGGLVVDTTVLLAGGRAAVAVVPRGTKVDLPALVNELKAEVIEATPADLPPPFTGAAGPIPPLGTALGVPTIIDTRVTIASAVVFEAFSRSDCIEIPYDEFARLERPRIASFAAFGELPERTDTQQPARKVA
jgi:prolyl-tRNA editing enzyme YbaK/EbsC (Cys-tRNA(Pro) deacylase)